MNRRPPHGPSHRQALRLSLISVALVLPLFTAQACGPEFFPDVFVHKLRPDEPKEYAQGKLGILLPTYPRKDLIVAYRYLNGGSLSPKEQHAYEPTWFRSEEDLSSDTDRPAEVKNAPPMPVEQWLHTRSTYTQSESPLETEHKKLQGDHPDWHFPYFHGDCNDNAFETAAATVTSRAKTWGQASPELVDWIKGQDAVFSNCPGKQSVMPAAASPNSSSLFKADRNYQTAAAKFYSGNLSGARQDFESIAKDTESPWHGIAGYLAARCLVRQAFAGQVSTDDGMAKFDHDIMQEAATTLRALLKQKTVGISHQAIQNELNFVRLRLEPVARIRELSAALAGPEQDQDYEQHLQDLTWYLDINLDSKAVREDSNEYDVLRGDQVGKDPQQIAQAMDAQFAAAYKELASLRASSPLVDWLITLQSPAESAAAHALEQWRSTHETAWLVAAIAKTKSADSHTSELIEIAAQIKPDAPAWESITYHRIRLLLALNRTDEARALLAEVMPRIQSGGRDSSVNAYAGLRMAAAPDLKEFLTYAPRKILIRSSQSQSALDECLEVMKSPKRKYDCRKNSDPNEFSEDAANAFNTQLPLATLTDIAASKQLAEPLNRSVVLMAWVRSLLLKDEVQAARLYPLLPETLKEQTSGGTGFRSMVTLVRNPGLRPYLDPGVQRSYSYDFIESYADNWWCDDWRSSPYGGFADYKLHALQPASVAFLTPVQKQDAEREVKTIMEQGTAEIYLGRQVVDYAKDHPQDPDVPESLFLVLRMMRYGCARNYLDTGAASKEKGNLEDAIRKEAARLLRQRYPASPWTKKAAPFVG